MKRIIAILLTVLLLGMLTACDQNVGRHADGIIKEPIKQPLKSARHIALLKV